MKTFETWKKMVDLYIEIIVGLDSESLPDAPYYRWFEEGMSPKKAAVKAIGRARNS